MCVSLPQVRRFFRPEFLNRLDDVVIFEPLQASQLREVARLMAQDLNTRLASRNITLNMTDAALNYATQVAYDPAYGARPLRRWLEHTILTELSRMIVAGRLPDNSTVVCDYDAGKGGLVYHVEAKPLAGGGGENQPGARTFNAIKRGMEPMGMDEDEEDDDEEMDV